MALGDSPGRKHYTNGTVTTQALGVFPYTSLYGIGSNYSDPVTIVQLTANAEDKSYPSGEILFDIPKGVTDQLCCAFIFYDAGKVFRSGLGLSYPDTRFAGQLKFTTVDPNVTLTHVYFLNEYNQTVQGNVAFNIPNLLLDVPQTYTWDAAADSLSSVYSSTQYEYALDYLVCLCFTNAAAHSGATIGITIDDDTSATHIMNSLPITNFDYITNRFVIRNDDGDLTPESSGTGATNAFPIDNTGLLLPDTWYRIRFNTLVEGYDKNYINPTLVWRYTGDTDWNVVGATTTIQDTPSAPKYTHNSDANTSRVINTGSTTAFRSTQSAFTSNNLLTQTFYCDSRATSSRYIEFEFYFKGDSGQLTSPNVDLALWDLGCDVLMTDTATISVIIANPTYGALDPSTTNCTVICTDLDSRYIDVGHMESSASVTVSMKADGLVLVEGFNDTFQLLEGTYTDVINPSIWLEEGDAESKWAYDTGYSFLTDGYY